MATVDRRSPFPSRPRSHHKSPSTDSFLADSLSRFVETLAENDASFSALPPRHSPRSTLSPMSSSNSSTPSAMRTGRRSLEIPCDADSSRGFASPRDVPRRLAMRLLVGDSGGAVDAATQRLGTPDKNTPRGSSGRLGVKNAGTRGRGDDWTGEFPLQEAEAGREGKSRRQGGGAAMFRSISEHVGADVTTPTSPASPASSPFGNQRNGSSRGRYLSRVGASEPLERSQPRKSRLNEDDNDASATTGPDGATDAEEESSDGSVSIRRLGREINELRKQLERCARINKWLTESLRSAERTAAEATAAAQAAASERDHVAKELEEMLNAWSQADEAATAKQEEERASTERSRASLERARAALAEEREAVGREREEVRREREEMKREREALRKDKERMARDAAERASHDAQSEWSKLQKQAEMMGGWQHQHVQHQRVTPDGVLLRSVSMNSTCSCLNSTRSSMEAKSSNGGVANQQPSKQGGSRSNGSTKNGASGGRWMGSCRSESDLGAFASRAREHAPSGLTHSASVGEYGLPSPGNVTSPNERASGLWVSESTGTGVSPRTSANSPPSRSPRSNSTGGYSSSSLSSVGSYSSVLDYGAKPPKSPGLLQDPRISGRRVKFSLID
ncbi:hypothetical protein CLOP_g22124 [Closterium sp. NIES-67]|nr:hypothetical protein CLOP_g22124 [Closterium sp. NIES-67]